MMATKRPSKGPSRDALAYGLLGRLYEHLCHVQRHFDEKWYLNDENYALQLETYMLTRQLYRLLKSKEATDAQEESNL